MPERIAGTDPVQYRFRNGAIAIINARTKFYKIIKGPTKRKGKKAKE